jgi:hypothetical protein
MGAANKPCMYAFKLEVEMDTGVWQEEIYINIIMSHKG